MCGGWACASYELACNNPPLSTLRYTGRDFIPTPCGPGDKCYVRDTSRKKNTNNCYVPHVLAPKEANLCWQKHGTNVEQKTEPKAEQQTEPKSDPKLASKPESPEKK
ncbi:uncharacterized protein [Drosophila bipectinata]|uniref:uncharacterized protein n=1 Tax=Drosophila bipectinata TaxID=42026 RepID=UPI001C89E9BC|nr:uncharacterized protein LOC108125434 [Drosophila bipectinata]